MTSIAESVATNLAQRLIDGAIREVNYLCCFKTHVGDFEKKRDLLVAKKDRVEKDIEDAKKRNETQVEKEVECWLIEANEVIDEDTKTNMKCFYGWCPNCIWQHRQGKKLAKKTIDMTGLIESYNFDRVACLAQPPGIKYYSPQNFIDFDSRKSNFKELVDILQDGSHYMIGLKGLGGTGKTTLATKVGEQVEESKAFQKVIFVVVSNPPDINKIQTNIASQLELQVVQEDKGKEAYSKLLWPRIAYYEGKVLIILDDIWEWLDLRDIGIPYGPNHKNCCVLITTRDLNVCEAMGCQQTIILDILNDEDALNLFIKHVGRRSDDSSREFNDLARGIAKECGGMPLAIVAVATTLKCWSLQDWKSALKALQNYEPLSNVHYKLEETVYRSFKLSYDHLEEKAKYLLILCSLFPEDYEIPIDLLSKLPIGLDLFREDNNYSEARRKVIPVKYDLIKSSLLLEAKKNCVKMHDLVREIALWIAKGNVQVIMNSSTMLKANLQFLFWSNDDFPNCFEGTKLEILIIWTNGEAKVRDATIFEGMANLKVLFLRGPSIVSQRKSFTPSLQSLLSLKNIRTLIFHDWKLGDISILKSLECLETFELEHCSITELPKEISELKMLKLLGLRMCDIGRNNPFEVIERCSQLEELYFVQNYNKVWKPAQNINKVAHDICPPMLQRYSIACSGFDCFDDNGLSKCFNIEHARELISTSICKDLIGRAEVLEFWETGETKWKNLVDRGMMNDLIMLYLCDLADIGCLIDIDMPPSSFGQLQILKLWNCKKLQQLCFDGNLKLPNLKSLHLKNCPMLQPSIFQSSVALCVEQLEELIIEDCKELRSLITYESLEEEILCVDQQKSYVASFQKLKSLQILRCGKLELVSPLFLVGDLSLLEDLCIRDCEEMKYIFGKYEGQALHHDIILPSLTKILLEEVPNFIDIFQECKICTQRSCPILKDDSKEKHAVSFSRAYGCCFLPTTKDNDIEVSSSSLQNVEETKESCASAKKIETFHTIECLMRQPWSLRNIRDMKLYNCSKLKSLFSASIATNIMLEKIEINLCEELKHIITNEVEDDEHLNCTSIFPKLQMLQVIACNKLEFIFPSTLSGGLQKLQHIEIKIAQRLKYVFGEYNNNHQNINVVPIDLPTLKILSLEDVPEIISLCANKYYVVWPSLQHITWSHCWGEIKRTLYFMASHEGRQLQSENGKGLIIRSLFPYFMFCSQPRQLNMKTSKDYMKVIMGLQNLIILEVGHSETIEEIFNVEGIQSEGPMTLSLQEMKLEDLGELRHIYKDPNNILSLLNLKVLKIDGCDKLRALFTTSTMKSLPRLSHLEVMNCEELVHLIEDDDYETSTYGRSHQLNFPMLETIHIHHCYGLRSLFSISTSTMLPNLKTLKIEVASSLEEVFRCQQDDTQEMFIQNVFPNLLKLKLIVLPELRTICQGINFHSVPELEVFFCPKYRENGSTTKGLQATHSTTDQAMLDMGEAKLEQEIETQELATSASPNLTENSKDAVKDIIEEVPTSKSAMSVVESFPEDSAIMKTTIGTTSIYSQAKGLQSDTSKLSSETRKEAVGMLLTSRLSMATTSSNLKSITGIIPEDSTNMKEKISTPSIYSQAEGLKSNPPVQVTPSIEGTLEQGPQQNYAIEEDIIANKSINLDLKKQSRLVGLLEKENAQSTNEASKDISESVSASGTSSELILFDSEFTIKETRNASILEGCNVEKATKANLSIESQSYSPNPIKDNMVLTDVIPPPHHQPQIGVAGSLSPTLEIGEIFQLVELKEGEPALLANALERYPQLRLPQEQRTSRIIALSYRVLVDILVMLVTKTPCTITASDRSILEDNLGEATILGFNNEWIESIHAKLSGSDTLDVLAAEKEMIDMEAKMETCEIVLEDVHKQRAEAKEWLEAIDSQLLGLLEDRKKLILRMGEIRELMSSKDKPFGF